MAAFEAKVALEAIRAELTTAELAKKYAVHPIMVSGWTRQAISNMALSFDVKPTAEPQMSTGEVEKLRAKIDQLKVEFFGRCLQSHPRHWRQKAVKQDHPRPGARRRCSLLS